ncbi:CidA/LrgA family holin-like protein [Bacillus sinesaloumensis]|uniref:CidA/LrgA family holin-like protein n=1 Tax=Litchfieldia sinesaloumensis TaxID=1926280 RepID=UPI0009883103|nr:CidA/LrgA family holin-like protein [Bacillus sinesaloumensis]
MKYVRICIQIIVLYAIYWMGAFIQGILNTSIPSSIIGMIILFFLLQTKVIKEKWLADGAQFLLTYLALLFVPATVGIIDYLSFFKGKGFVTVLLVLLSTFLVMMISGVVGGTLASKKTQDKNIGKEFGA